MFGMNQVVPENDDQRQQLQRTEPFVCLKTRARGKIGAVLLRRGEDAAGTEGCLMRAVFLNGSTQTRQLHRSGCDCRGTVKVLLGCDSHLHILNSRVH